MCAAGWSPKWSALPEAAPKLEAFHIVPFHMQVEVRNITVHGKESPSDVPLAHADSLVAQVKVISFLRTEFGFHSLTLDHPVVHISIGPDGSTNVPAPQVLQKPSENPPIEQLFALSIDHLTLRNGELLWGDQRIPLDFAVHDTSLEMDYSFLRGRYESHLALGKVDSAFRGIPSVRLEHRRRVQPGHDLRRRQIVEVELWPVIARSERAHQRFPQSPARRRVQRARRSRGGGRDCPPA